MKLTKQGNKIFIFTCSDEEETFLEVKYEKILPDSCPVTHGTEVKPQILANHHVSSTLRLLD